jgi:hypothetical protein
MPPISPIFFMSRASKFDGLRFRRQYIRVYWRGVCKDFDETVLPCKKILLAD